MSGYILCTDIPLPPNPADCVALQYAEQPSLLLPPLSINDALALAGPITLLFAVAWGFKQAGKFVSTFR